MMTLNVMTPIKPPDSFHLQAAQGWLELGNPTEAGQDLSKISRCKQLHPDVLNLWCEIHAAACNWKAALEVANKLIWLDAEEPLGWLHKSYALHKLKRTVEARDTLAQVADNFPLSPAIRYDLACYECQLGLLEQARKWLEEALDIGDAKKMKLAALQDLDLEPLWKDIGKA